MTQEAREPGGPAAIRGFRLQVLYALDLLLGGAERLRLEGVEDVDLLGPNGELVEAVQVKAHATPLALSNLKSKSGDTSFFVRLRDQLPTNSGLRGGIVSFGPVGPELQGAFDGHSAHLQSVTRKLRDDYEVENADHLIALVRLIREDEAQLYERIDARLRDRCPAASAQTCTQLLCSGLLMSAERRAVVTQRELEQQLLAAAAFAADCRAYADEWFRTITPLMTPHSLDAQTLANEFHQGIAARYEHIAALVDVVRSRLLASIVEAFETTRMVVLHGASGEGKSTLLFRFAEDHAKDRHRFLVDVDADLAKTLQIAAALAAFARNSHSEILLLLDVRPGNRNWRSLGEQLASASNVKILVGVREEDWLEAHMLSYRIRLRDLPIRLDEVVVWFVFEQLQNTSADESFVSFDDAWSAVGGAGPMLEFVHLVTRHQSLRARLREQVGRLLTGWSEACARFTRFAACATGYGGRVSIVGLVAASGLGLAEAVSLIQRLEEEYFLRRAAGGEWIEPVHPIRSRVGFELVFDPKHEPLQHGL